MHRGSIKNRLRFIIQQRNSQAAVLRLVHTAKGRLRFREETNFERHSYFWRVHYERQPEIHRETKRRFVVYPSNCHVVIILCNVGGGFRWRDTRAAAPDAASRLLSYCQNPGVPRPADWPGLTHTQSGDRDPQW